MAEVRFVLISDKPFILPKGLTSMGNFYMSVDVIPLVSLALRRADVAMRVEQADELVGARLHIDPQSREKFARLDQGLCRRCSK